MNQLMMVVSLVLVRGVKESFAIRLLTRRLPSDLIHAVVEWMPMAAIPVNKLVDAKASVDSGIGWRRACHDEVQRRLWMCNERITRLKGNPDGHEHLRFLASNNTYTILLDNAACRSRYLNFDMMAWVKCRHCKHCGCQIRNIRVNKIIHPDQVCSWVELNFVDQVVKWAQGSETFGVSVPGNIDSVMFFWRNKGLVMRDVIKGYKGNIMPVLATDAFDTQRNWILRQELRHRLSRHRVMGHYRQTPVLQRRRIGRNLTMCVIM